MPRESGASSTHESFRPTANADDYWIIRFCGRWQQQRL